MGYTPRSLGHVNIFVRNAERSREWYEDLLGLHTYGFFPGVPPSCPLTWGTPTRSR